MALLGVGSYTARPAHLLVAGDVVGVPRIGRRYGGGVLRSSSRTSGTEWRPRRRCDDLQNPIVHVAKVSAPRPGHENAVT